MASLLSIALALVLASVTRSPSAQCATTPGSSSKPIASQTQSAALPATSAAAAIDPCGLSVPDPRVINSCGNSDDIFLSNTARFGLEPYAVQCLSNGTYPNTHFNQDNCVALIPSICALMTKDDTSALYTQTKWIWFNIQGCSIGCWVPGPYQGTNNAEQKVTVKPTRITVQDGCQVEVFGSIFHACFDSDEYDMATVNLAELPSETGTGAPVPGGSAPGFPSYSNARQQVGGCEDTTCYNADSVRVSCNCF